MDAGSRSSRHPCHLRSASGFSLVELLTALLMVSVLLTLGVGVYLSVRDEGKITAAELNVREALGAVHTYHAENDTYSGMSRVALESIDGGLRLSREPVVSADGKRYCVESTHNGRATTAPSEPGFNTHSSEGPGGEILPGTCPASL